MEETIGTTGLLKRAPRRPTTQCNFKIEDDLLDTLKEVAKASGVSVSSVLRQALLALPLGPDGSVADIIARKRSSITMEDLQDRWARQEHALRLAAKTNIDLLEHLGGSKEPELDALKARLDMMGKWAARVEKWMLRVKEAIGNDSNGLPSFSDVEL